jgi:hypothetical protein
LNEIKPLEIKLNKKIIKTFSALNCAKTKHSESPFTAIIGKYIEYKESN